MEAFLVYLAGVSFLMIALYVVNKKQTHSDVKHFQSNVERLRLQLEQFQKGNYQVALQTEQSSKASEQWITIWDQLIQLGYYFERVQAKLEVEENNTKSLISDISHQLKTPLASLRMSHELLQSDGLTQEEKDEFFYKEEVEIHRLELLLQELVNLSRLERHMIQIEPEPSGIKQTITGAVNIVIMKAIAKNIDVQVNISEEVVVCHDSKWTVEAIANVLDNAIKYSHENSVISIVTHQLPNLLLIEIEDEGIGIPMEEIHKIFQRFYRGKEALKMTKDGAGIGLYLTRRILEQQGATIVAKRKQNQGTIFKINFPL